MLLKGLPRPEVCGPVCLCVCVYGQLSTHAAQLTLYPQICFQWTATSRAHPAQPQGVLMSVFS